MSEETEKEVVTVRDFKAMIEGMESEKGFEKPD